MTRKVSVIIPFYSGANWLCDAVRSVLNQTYKNLEIIVINDGSPEDISSFLNLYQNDVIYRYKENGGAATARNLGMSLATGDYFAFLDSDDIWLPEKTEKQIALMNESGSMWSHTGFYYWTPKNDKLKYIDNSFDYGNVYIKTYISIKIATPCVIVDRKALIEHPEIIFPNNLRKGQDTVFFRELSIHYKLALLKEPLVKVRMRGDNSNTIAITRFHFKRNQYLEVKNNPIIPKGVKYLSCIYYVYSNVFGSRTSKYKELIAKLFWIFPYIIERVYIKKFNREIKLNKNYNSYVK